MFLRNFYLYKRQSYSIRHSVQFIGQDVPTDTLTLGPLYITAGKYQQN